MVKEGVSYNESIVGLGINNSSNEPPKEWGFYVGLATGFLKKLHTHNLHETIAHKFSSNIL